MANRSSVAEINNVNGISWQPVPCGYCGGSGKKGRHRCRQCNGTGEITSIGNHKVYVPLLSELKLERDRERLLAQSWFRFVMFAVSVAGLVYLVLDSAIDITTGEMMPFKLILKDGLGPLLFWMSGLAGLYVYSSIERDVAGTKRVSKRIYETQNTTERTSKIFRNKKSVNIYETLTVPARKHLLGSLRLAKRLGHQFSGAHLFLTLILDPTVKAMLTRLGVSAQNVQKKMIRSLQNQLAFKSIELKSILFRAYLEAYRDRRRHVDVPAIFSAVTALDPLVAEVLYDFGIDESKVRNVVVWEQNDNKVRNRYRHLRAKSKLRPRTGLDRAMTALATPMLDHFSEDLTAQAQRGYFLPSIRRADTMGAILRIFESNGAPILVGEDGVGKKGLLEDLADRMVSNDVPANLKDKRLVSLALSKVVSGVTPAEAGQRILQILREAQRAGNIVLVVRNIHGAHGITSGSEGSVDLAEVFASGLKRMGAQSLATTNPTAYHRYLEGASLGGYFEMVKIPEPDIDEAIQIVESRIGLTEMRQGVYFSYEAIARLVELADKFIRDRFLPKKAIELVDELALFVREGSHPHKVILVEDVDQFMKTKLNIPTQRVGRDESELLLNFEDKIHERLIDQEEAVDAVANAIRRARAAVRDVKRPIVNLLFLGPTGVGKTELAKTVASLYFGDEKHMIRIDMSEYQDSSSIGRLLGTGRNAPGLLTQAVRSNPFSLVLLDEIDKANRDVLNIFLQIMDDGRVTSGVGEVVDFTNVILIATSNAGTAFIQEAVKQNVPTEEIKQSLLDTELGKHFLPEFINRFDGVIVFKPLEPTHVIEITKLLLGGVAQRLEDQGITFTATEEAVKELAILGYDPLFGARPLKRVIQDRVDSILAKYLLEGRLQRRDKIILKANGELEIEKALQL